MQTEDTGAALPATLSRRHSRTIAALAVVTAVVGAGAVALTRAASEVADVEVGAPDSVGEPDLPFQQLVLEVLDELSEAAGPRLAKMEFTDNNTKLTVWFTEVPSGYERDVARLLGEAADRVTLRGGAAMTSEEAEALGEHDGRQVDPVTGRPTEMREYHGDVTTVP